MPRHFLDAKVFSLYTHNRSGSYSSLYTFQFIHGVDYGTVEGQWQSVPAFIPAIGHNLISNFLVVENLKEQK